MKLNQILGTEFPIMQGGMAQVATGAFAAAVSNAGALGIIGTGAMNGEMMRKEIETAKSLTDKPFGVNLMMMNPDVEEMAQIIAEEKPSVVTTGAGNPGKYVKMWKEQGIKVIPVVSSVALAKRLEREGVDAIIAEGTESGGHIGELTTMVLLPQVADAVSVPVIGAGGIASGRQMKAAEILGAVGVQIGTVLLGSEECPIHANYKNALIKAKDRATVVTGRSVGVPVRVLKNGMTRDYLELEQSGAEKMELEKFTLGALRRAVHEGDVDRGSLMAGQDASYIKEIRPLRVILEEMMKEYESL
ncbi:MAG: nitronate monooxygenase [Clostridia bacterium]|uniref:nitronate monooxygenase n=1 Tax=Mogibacterium TaxID=86331 RepID=UPI00240A2ACD|nr:MULTISPECIES: nitronate monooxygenase [Mogibacterium]MDY5450705.1 nitronate monooxygenase [Clostridia bacterium]MBN2936153.1 nitronate monooxygenase [Mogibacterium sp.]MCI7123180.1 nitronate monooxygenase [Mogibacterium sp.]MDD6700364.1 nitronate monooxygenase [Mogibacterium kristiansenii]MEE0370393.1 nitronate monooxygenase [Clostridia bacterium]